MDIVDVTLFHAPQSGGVRTYLEAKRQRLGRCSGIRYCLLKPGPFASTDPDTITVPAPPLPFSGGYRFPLRRRGFARQLIRLDPHLIEADDPYVPAWAAVKAARRLGIPIVGFYHSDLVRLLGNRLGPLVIPPLRLYVHLLYRQFDLVLAPSRTVADQLMRCGLSDVEVQPLGVDLERFHPRRASADLRFQLGLPPGTRLLVFVGRGSREKNLPILMQTANLLGNGYRLLLMGSNMPRRVPSNVTVINRFGDPDTVAQLLATADALLHAGDQETFGLVVLEAMASGTPVVVANAGALPELVPKDCGTLARPRDPADMARAVRELFECDPLLLGQNARRHVERHYNWDRVVDSLVQRYRGLAGHPTRLALEWSHG